MRNDRAYKETINNLMYLGLAFLLTIIITIVGKNIIVFLYTYTKIEMINGLMRVIYAYGNFIIIVQGALFIFIYYAIVYTKNKKHFEKIEKLENLEIDIDDIIEKTNAMALGNLDLNIDIQDYSKKAKDLGRDINEIVYKLKNITIEEKKAQNTKDDLITNVSHDLRTPLTSIIGYLNLIENDNYKDEVELRYYTSGAYSKAKSLRVLIDDLFQLTKYQNGGVRLICETIDLTELLWQLISDFQFELIQNDMEMRPYFSEEKMNIKCDSNKLVRAFENIISNSIKYGKEGKYIDIKTELKEGFVEIIIINYGEMIPENEIDHIFDRFYRLDKSRNSETSGSGLGLCITKSIVELHGGTVSANSSEFKVEFKMKLPII